MDQRECVDVVVCGGGAAGMAAALVAARGGAAVTLIESAPRLGGTVAHALIHTLGGLYGPDGELLNDGLPRELCTRLLSADRDARPRRIGRAWVLSVSPRMYQETTQRWLEETQGIRVLLGTRVIEVEMAAGTVRAVRASEPGGSRRIVAGAFIDATGTAELVRRVDAELLQDDAGRAAGGLIFTLRGVTPGTLAPPKGVALVRALRRAAEQGALPPRCRHTWLDVGVRDDEVYVKLFVPMPRHANGADVAAAAEREQTAVVAFLRQWPGFGEAEVACTGCIGVRDGGRVLGEYCLSAADVRQARKFPDAACRACWPIEYWDPEMGVSLEYLTAGGYYEIPLRALRVRGLANVWAAGKCLSADPLAHASARVAGTCWAMGEAAGRAAALGE